MLQNNVFSLKMFKHSNNAERPIFLFDLLVAVVFFTTVIDFLFQKVDKETPKSTSMPIDFVPYRTGTTHRASYIRIRFQPGVNDISRVFEATFYAGLQNYAVLYTTHFHAFWFLFYVKL